MKHVFILMVALAAMNAAAGVKIVAVDSHSGGTENTMYVSGDALRVDAPGEQMTILFDSKQQVLNHVDHRQRSYMRLDEKTVAELSSTMDAAMAQMQSAMANVPEAQREMMQKMMGGMGISTPSAPPPEPVRVVKKTRKKQTINGYPCVKYHVLLDGQLSSEIWVAPYSALGVSKSDLSGLQALTDFQETLAGAFSRQPALAQRIKSSVVSYDELGGMPIKIVMYDDGAVSGETTIQSVEKTRLKDQLFEIPSGYTKKEMPQMPKGGN